MSNVTFKNIFDAVTDKQDEASDMRMRSKLAIALRDAMEVNRWTPEQAAAHLEIPQSTLDRCLNGDLTYNLAGMHGLWEKEMLALDAETRTWLAAHMRDEEP
jgi:predicted XRE-type DNA-binding protein